MTTLPRSLRDGFLGGYLPYLVMLHFDTLEVLLAAQDLPSVAARMKSLPLGGPETVSRVFQLESILVSQGVRPPAPPSTSAGCATWSQGIDGVFQRLERTTAAGELRLQRDDAFALPRREGAILGDLEHSLALWWLVGELLQERPDHAFLRRQRDALFAGLRTAPRATTAMVGVDASSPFAHGIAHAIALAEQGKRLASTGAAPEAIAGMLAHVRRATRALERRCAARGPSDAIAAHARAEIDRDSLHRALLEHPSWCTSAQRPIEGGTHFVASSPAVIAPWASATGRGTEVRELGSGWEWALGAPPDVQRVVLDPMAAAEHRIDDATWPAFRLRALESRVASAWRDWSRLDLAFLQRAPHAVAMGADGVPLPVPWADELGRPFAAMFTCATELRRGLEASGRALPAGATMGIASGRDIAARLLAANAPGLAVDPVGLERPRTFSRGMLERLAAAA